MLTIADSYAMSTDKPWASACKAPVFDYVQAGAIFVQERRGSLVADPIARRKIAVLGCEQFIKKTREKKGHAFVLIVCTKDDYQRWRKKLRKYYAHPYTLHDCAGIDGGRGAVEDIPEDDGKDQIFIALWSKIPRHPGLADRPWDVLIVDECHMGNRACYEKASKRGTLVMGNPREPSPSIKARKKVFLSDKTFTKSPMEMFAIGNSLCPGVHGTFPEFAANYTKMEWRQHFRRGFNPDDELDPGLYFSSHRKKFDICLTPLQKVARENYMIRRPIKKSMLLVDPNWKGGRSGRSWIEYSLTDKRIPGVEIPKNKVKKTLDIQPKIGYNSTIV